ncbi:hypothetical protein [Cellulomonas sp. Leaf334]|uniref:hypothetical protein n=1 Tax=Cellulomonas sp. Leaf334 TaxID=1736339 RepID=UPI0006F41BD1|nr:hypothetical protein [Cellulomonas sp. Leaf334]KQR17319.1 hypothetical protein ASF78_08515 [Cellulomonas sp. Leaf334]
MNRHDDIAATLRMLDPAERHVDPGSARARADLRTILTTDPVPPAAPAPRPRRTARQVVLVAGVAVAATVALVVLPSLSGDDQAIATWTAAPTDVSPEQTPEAAERCRKQYEEGPSQVKPDLSGTEPVIAERRGAWTTVVLAGAGGFSAVCITDDTGTGMIGSWGTPSGYVAPGPRELYAFTLSTGTTGAGDISMIDGTSGTDVVGVVYRSRSHGDVVATVNKGHFALWFPGDELGEAHIDGVDVEAIFTDGTTTTLHLSY